MAVGSVVADLAIVEGLLIWSNHIDKANDATEDATVTAKMTSTAIGNSGGSRGSGWCRRASNGDEEEKAEETMEAAATAKEAVSYNGRKRKR